MASERIREGRLKWEGGLLSFTFPCPRIQFRTTTNQVQEEYNEGIVLKVSAFRSAFRWMVVNVFLPLR